MSQFDIITLLEKKGEPLCRSQIALELNQNPCKVSHTLKRLIEIEEISFIEYNIQTVQRKFNLKVPKRTRFYFIID
jgi:Mn-dependent DtxR family transcriptional regulator